MFQKTDHDLSFNKATLDIAALKYVADVAMSHVLNDIYEKAKSILILSSDRTLQDTLTAESIENLAFRLRITAETRHALYGTDERSQIRIVNHAAAKDG